MSKAQSFITSDKKIAQGSSIAKSPGSKGSPGDQSVNEDQLEIFQKYETHYRDKIKNYRKKLFNL